MKRTERTLNWMNREDWNSKIAGSRRSIQSYILTNTMGSKEETSDSSAGFSADRHREIEKREEKKNDRPDRQKRGEIDWDRNIFPRPRYPTGGLILPRQKASKNKNTTTTKMLLGSAYRAQQKHGLHLLFRHSTACVRSGTTGTGRQEGRKEGRLTARRGRHSPR